MPEQDWFAENAPKQSSDWFAANAPGSSNAVIKTAPAPGSWAWFKEKAYQGADAIAEALPGVGATVGGAVGGGAGLVGGPAAPVTSPAGAAVGATLGGAAGEAGRIAIRKSLGWDAPDSLVDQLLEIGKQGALQGVIEAGTKGLSSLSPALRNLAKDQYFRALSPGASEGLTAREAKDVATRITPQLLNRGVHGSLPQIEQQATSAVDGLRPQLNQAFDNIPDSQLAPVLQQYNSAAVPGGTSQEISAALATRRAQAQAGSLAGTVPQSVYGAPNRIANEVGTQAATIPESVFAAKQGSGLTMQKIPGPTSGAGAVIYSDLEDLKAKYIVTGKVMRPDAVNAIDGVQNLVAQHGDDIPAKSLRSLRQIFDDPVAQAGGYAGANLSDRFTLKAEQTAANSIRGILSQASPDVAALNKEMNFWLNVQEITQGTNLRRVGQEGGLVKTLTPLAAGAAGGIAGGMAQGGIGAGVGATTAATLTGMTAYAMRQPAWRTMSAVAKSALADALARGDGQAAAAILTRAGVAVARAIASPTEQQPQLALGPQ